MRYEFKVGDRGLTRDGRPYEVIYVNPSFLQSKQIYARVEGTPFLISVDIFGMWNSFGDSSLDLIPPARSVWVLLVEDDDDDNTGCIAISLPTLSAANEQADAYRRDPNYTVLGIHQIEIGAKK